MQCTVGGKSCPFNGRNTPNLKGKRGQSSKSVYELKG